MQSHLASKWHDHQQLLVGTAFQLGLGFQALYPCFLADGASTVRFIFIKCDELAEVDLLVEDVLKRRRDVIGMVVLMAVAMVMVLVVAV